MNITKNVYLKHPYTNQIKTAPTGANWWALFFNIFVPLKRGDYKSFFLGALLILIIVGIVSSKGNARGVGGLVGIIMCWKYNEWYLKNLLLNGYKITSLPMTVSAEELSKKTGIDIKSLMA